MIGRTIVGILITVLFYKGNKEISKLKADLSLLYLELEKQKKWREALVKHLD